MFSSRVIQPSRSSHKPSSSAKSSQRIASGDFKSWERYDADAEASKVDEESEEGEGEGEGRGRVTIVRGELTETGGYLKRMGVDFQSQFEGMGNF